jgi:hypothetical protein
LQNCAYCTRRTGKRHSSPSDRQRRDRFALSRSNGAVNFHARPNVYGQLTYEELEFEKREAGKQIYVYLVRLGL